MRSNLEGYNSANPILVKNLLVSLGSSFVLQPKSMGIVGNFFRPAPKNLDGDVWGRSEVGSVEVRLRISVTR